MALHPGRDIGHHRLDLLAAQKGRCLGRKVGAEVGLGQAAVALVFLVSMAVVIGHPRGRPAAADHFQQAVAIEDGRAQRERGAAIAAAAAAMPLVAADAIRLLVHLLAPLEVSLCHGRPGR
jgi:hypothetical protein